MTHSWFSAVVFVIHNSFWFYSSICRVPVLLPVQQLQEPRWGEWRGARRLFSPWDVQQRGAAFLTVWRISQQCSGVRNWGVERGTEASSLQRGLRLSGHAVRDSAEEGGPHSPGSSEGTKQHTQLLKSQMIGGVTPTSLFYRHFTMSVYYRLQYPFPPLFCRWLWSKQEWWSKRTNLYSSWADCTSHTSTSLSM